jgi:hypothetical protein
MRTGSGILACRPAGAQVGWLAACIAAGIATCIDSGCSHPEKAAAPKAAEPVRITQFYTSASNIAKGDKALVCYGV